METVGKYLKRERELRNISLQEISAATKIRENILKAIEEDRYDVLPTPVFVKGFLVAYVKHVGLDPRDVVLRYESDLKELQGYEENGVSAQRKKGWNRALLFGPIIVMVGLGIILFSPWRQTEVSEEPGPETAEETPVVQEETPPPPVVPEKEETVPPVGETTSLEQAPVLEETIVIKETPPDQTKLIQRISEPKPMDRGNLTLQIQAIEETWIAFQVDSHLPREITLRAGQPFSQRADDHIKLKIGNAGGVIVTFNGKDLGSLGDPGKVVRLSLTQKGYEFKQKDDFEIPGYDDEVKPTDIH